MTTADMILQLGIAKAQLGVLRRENKGEAIVRLDAVLHVVELVIAEITKRGEATEQLL